MKATINGNKIELEGSVHEIVEVVTIMDRRNMSSATTVEVSEPVQKVVKTDTVKKKRATRVKRRKEVPWRKILGMDVSKYAKNELATGKTPRQIRYDIKQRVKDFGYGIKSRMLIKRLYSAIHTGKNLAKAEKQATVTPNV